MSDIINKLLLVGDTFMPKMHLRQPQFTYSACGTFTKHKKRIQKFKETGDLRDKETKHLILLKIQNMMGIKED